MSMIELLAAVLLVSFGILGLLSLVSRATQASVGSEDNLRAALLANEMATIMWNAGTVSVPAATVSAWSTQRVSSTANPAGGLAGGSGTVVVASGIARVTVSWTTPSGQARQYKTDVVIP